MAIQPLADGTTTTEPNDSMPPSRESLKTESLLAEGSTLRIVGGVRGLYKPVNSAFTDTDFPNQPSILNKTIFIVATMPNIPIRVKMERCIHMEASKISIFQCGGRVDSRRSITLAIRGLHYTTMTIVRLKAP